MNIFVGQVVMDENNIENPFINQQRKSKTTTTILFLSYSTVKSHNGFWYDSNFAGCFDCAWYHNLWMNSHILQYVTQTTSSPERLDFQLPGWHTVNRPQYSMCTMDPQPYEHSHANPWSSVCLFRWIIDLSSHGSSWSAQTMYESFWKAVECLTRFTERICTHCESVPGDSHFRFGCWLLPKMQCAKWHSTSPVYSSNLLA